MEKNISTKMRQCYVGSKIGWQVLTFCLGVRRERERERESSVTDCDRRGFNFLQDISKLITFGLLIKGTSLSLLIK